VDLRLIEQLDYINFRLGHKIKGFILNCNIIQNNSSNKYNP